MFGHGQFEGYSEQYGMEFRRPQRDEWPDEGLVERHRREISPLLHERWRFSGAAGFRQLTALEGGGPTPDVFTYANDAQSGPRSAPERRSLVVYLNRYPRAQVRIPGVAEALGLGHDPDGFLILHDHRSGLDYLRQLRDLRANGLELALDGYGCHVFLGFEEVSDGGGAGWAELAHRLGLDGVPDAHLALRRMREEPVRQAVADVFATRVAEEAFLPELSVDPETQSGADAARANLTAAIDRLATAVGSTEDTVSVAYEMSRLANRVRTVRPRLLAQAVAGWVVFGAVGDLAFDGDVERTTVAFDDWDAAASVGDLARRSGSGDAQAWRAVELTRALLAVLPGELAAAAEADGLPGVWFEYGAVRAASGWNEWEGDTYIAQEAWDELVDALAARDAMLDLPDAVEAAAELRRRAAASGYRLLVPLDGSGPPPHT
jgi:hypothetical protein